MIIEYWSDFTCPFCYIAETRLRKALAELEIEDETKIVFKAFRLNPAASVTPKRTVVEGFARHYGMSLEAAAARVESISAMGRGEGLDFNYGTAHVTSTFDALRMAKFAQSKGNDICNRFVDLAYEAFFSKNLIMSDREAVLGIAEACGLDPGEAASVWDSDAFGAEVERDEREASMLGLSAVPFFAINRAYGIPGAVDTRDFKRVLMRAYSEEEAESVSGAVCGPDGCGPKST
jgi:predicted DsbA family dithiol-disulfide isomerase